MADDKKPLPLTEAEERDVREVMRESKRCQCIDCINARRLLATLDATRAQLAKAEAIYRKTAVAVGADSMAAECIARNPEKLVLAAQRRSDEWVRAQDSNQKEALAAECEELRAQLTAATQRATEAERFCLEWAGKLDVAVVERDAARREVERMREALQEIADYAKGCAYGDSRVEQCESSARAALSEPSPAPNAGVTVIADPSMPRDEVELRSGVDAVRVKIAPPTPPPAHCRDGWRGCCVRTRGECVCSCAKCVNARAAPITAHIDAELTAPPPEELTAEDSDILLNCMRRVFGSERQWAVGIKQLADRVRALAEKAKK